MAHINRLVLLAVACLHTPPHAYRRSLTKQIEALSSSGIFEVNESVDFTTSPAPTKRSHDDLLNSEVKDHVYPATLWQMYASPTTATPWNRCLACDKGDLTNKGILYTSCLNRTEERYKKTCVPEKVRIGSACCVISLRNRNCNNGKALQRAKQRCSTIVTDEVGGGCFLSNTFRFKDQDVAWSLEGKNCVPKDSAVSFDDMAYRREQQKRTPSKRKRSEPGKMRRDKTRSRGIGHLKGAHRKNEGVATHDQGQRGATHITDRTQNQHEQETPRPGKSGRTEDGAGNEEEIVIKRPRGDLPKRDDTQNKGEQTAKGHQSQDVEDGEGAGRDRTRSEDQDGSPSLEIENNGMEDQSTQDTAHPRIESEQAHRVDDTEAVTVVKSHDVMPSRDQSETHGQSANANSKCCCVWIDDAKFEGGGGLLALHVNEPRLVGRSGFRTKGCPAVSMAVEPDKNKKKVLLRWESLCGCPGILWRPMKCRFSTFGEYRSFQTHGVNYYGKWFGKVTQDSCMQKCKENNSTLHASDKAVTVTKQVTKQCEG